MLCGATEGSLSLQQCVSPRAGPGTVCLVKAPAIQVERERRDKENVIWDALQGYHPRAESEKTRRLRCPIISRFQASEMSRRTSLQTGQNEEKQA